MEISKIQEIQSQHAIRPGEIVIEIDNEHLIVKETPILDSSDPFNTMKMKISREEFTAGNSHQYFFPVSERKNGTNFIRTRQVLLRNGTMERFSYDPALQNIDVIPGERIHLDPTKRVGRITDSIFDPENDAACIQLIRAAQKMGWSKLFVPSEYVERSLRDDYAYWTWAFWMRKIMDGDTYHNAGPERHRGCATSGPRLCRPIQNVELMPTLDECAKSMKVRHSLTFKTREDFEDFEKDRKENDPDYKQGERNNVTITPYLAGVEAEEQ